MYKSVVLKIITFPLPPKKKRFYMEQSTITTKISSRVTNYLTILLLQFWCSRLWMVNYHLYIDLFFFTNHTLSHHSYDKKLWKIKCYLTFPNHHWSLERIRGQVLSFLHPKPWHSNKKKANHSSPREQQIKQKYYLQNVSLYY